MHKNIFKIEEKELCLLTEQGFMWKPVTAAMA